MIATPSETPVKFALVTDSEGLNALEADWRTLHAQSEHAPYFVSFDWMSAAWECVASPNGRQLRVVVGRCGNRVVLIWPLIIYQRGHAYMLGSEKFE